tara:strand:+ start:615 stop:2123 length:1509 start_codon:yes stop_codon:yes gene_type:complete
MKYIKHYIVIICILGIVFSEITRLDNCIQKHSRVGRVTYQYEEILESEHFLVHYTNSPLDSQFVNGNLTFPMTNENYVQSIIELLEYTLPFYLQQGWEIFPPDCDESIIDLNSEDNCINFGGNSKYDVYISNFGVGLVAPENIYQEEPYTSGWTSYMHISSFQNLYQTYPTWSHHVIAHELHHAIQLRYGYGTSGNPGNYSHNAWFFEQSATYMEDVIFPYSTHLRTMLSNCNVVTPLTFPEHPIGYPYEIYPYRSALWPKFLVENYGDSSILRYQWEEYGLQYANGQNISLYPIYDNSIQIATNGSVSMEKAIADYGLWRYFTGERFLENYFFDEANYYCTSKIIQPEEIDSIITKNGSAKFIELPNLDKNVYIETNNSIINASYLKINNEELVIQEINFDNPQFNYFSEENTEHILIITSGYSDNESEKVGVTISLNEPILIGDINGDLVLNVIDIVQLVNQILENTQYDNEQLQIIDLNQDELVNILDIVILINLILYI